MQRSGLAVSRMFDASAVDDAIDDDTPDDTGFLHVADTQDDTHGIEHDLDTVVDDDSDSEWNDEPVADVRIEAHSSSRPESALLRSRPQSASTAPHLSTGHQLDNSFVETSHAPLQQLSANFMPTLLSRRPLATIESVESSPAAPPLRPPPLLPLTQVSLASSHSDEPKSVDRIHAISLLSAIEAVAHDDDAIDSAKSDRSFDLNSYMIGLYQRAGFHVDESLLNSSRSHSSTELEHELLPSFNENSVNLSSHFNSDPSREGGDDIAAIVSDLKMLPPMPLIQTKSTTPKALLAPLAPLAPLSPLPLPTLAALHTASSPSVQSTTLKSVQTTPAHAQQTSSSNQLSPLPLPTLTPLPTLVPLSSLAPPSLPSLSGPAFHALSPKTISSIPAPVQQVDLSARSSTKQVDSSHHEPQSSSAPIALAPLSIPDSASPPPKSSPGTKSSIAYVTITGIQVLTPSTPAYDKVRPVLSSLSTCSPSEGHWTRPPPSIEIVSRSLHGQEPNWQPRRPQSASPVHRASLSPLTGRSPFTSPSSPPSRPASAHPKSTLSDREQALIERLYKPPPRPLPAYASALSIGLKSQIAAEHVSPYNRPIVNDPSTHFVGAGVGVPRTDEFVSRLVGLSDRLSSKEMQIEAIINKRKDVPSHGYGRIRPATAAPASKPHVSFSKPVISSPTTPSPSKHRPQSALYSSSSSSNLNKRPASASPVMIRSVSSTDPSSASHSSFQALKQKSAEYRASMAESQVAAAAASLRARLHQPSTQNATQAAQVYLRTVNQAKILPFDVSKALMSATHGAVTT